MGGKPKLDFEALKRGGVVKLRGKDMFAIWVKSSCNNINSEQLRKVADISDSYARGLILFTSRQIPMIPFVNLKDVETVKNELTRVHLELDRCGSRVRNINVCYEARICSEAAADCISLGERLEKYFYDPILHKIKIGIAGCTKDCIISRTLNDVALIATEMGYDAFLGGKLGVNPFVGVKMASGLSEEKCVRFVQNYFDLLNNEGNPGERAADIIKRLGVEKIQRALNTRLDEKMGGESITCRTIFRGIVNNGKYILKIRAVCGEITSLQARKIADISEKYGKGIVHFAVRGDPEIPYVDRKDVKNIEKELQTVRLHLLDGRIDNIQACFGDYCKNSTYNTQSYLRNVENMVGEVGLHDFDIKISGSGCPNSCGISHMNDIGFVGVVEPEVDSEKCTGCDICIKVCKKKAIEVVPVSGTSQAKSGKIAVIDRTKCAYCGDCIRSCPFDAFREKRKGISILAGGREGEDVRLGQVIAQFVSEDESLRITGKCLRILKEKNAHASAVIDDVGLEKFQEMLGIRKGAA